MTVIEMSGDVGTLAFSIVPVVTVAIPPLPAVVSHGAVVRAVLGMVVTGIVMPAVPQAQCSPLPSPAMASAITLHWIETETDLVLDHTY